MPARAVAGYPLDYYGFHVGGLFHGPHFTTLPQEIDRSRLNPDLPRAASTEAFNKARFFIFIEEDP